MEPRAQGRAEREETGEEAPLQGTDADPDLARGKRIVARLVERGLYRFVREAMKEHHVLESDIFGRRRTRSCVQARHLLWRSLHDHAELSWPEIGEIFETHHSNLIQATSYRESRERETAERNVIGRIVAYVRRLGFAVLAAEIDAGAWREPYKRCSVPSCPRKANRGGRCTAHPPKEIKRTA